MKSRFLFALLLITSTACTHSDPRLGLVDTKALGNTRNLHFRRTLTHFHSPFSFDACDDHGILDGKVNPACLKDVREAVCEDHEDVVFATDHPNNMARFPFETLFMHQDQDEWILSADGKKTGNRIHCENGFKADWYPGIESRLLGLGMQMHSSPDIEERIFLYNGENMKTKNELEAKTHALIAIPHTESRTLEYLETMRPAAIEIYNLHAALDPRISMKFLNVNLLGRVWIFGRYLLDPFNTGDANFIFPEFYEISPVYFQKWDALQAKGIFATGLGGADSHETIFKQKMSDGERLDHHRRMIRFFSNFILTEKDDEDSIKAAIIGGRDYFVVEALGTPLGMDFHFSSSEPDARVLAEVGDQLKETPGALSFHLPTLYPAPEFANDPKPEIWAELIRVDSEAHETVMTEAGNHEDIVYPNPAPGHYRVHVWIKPRHLKSHLYTKSLSEKPFLWVISNPIHILPNIKILSK